MDFCFISHILRKLLRRRKIRRTFFPSCHLLKLPSFCMRGWFHILCLVFSFTLTTNQKHILFTNPAEYFSFCIIRTQLVVATISKETPRLSLGSSHLLQLLWRDPKVLLQQLKDVFFPACPGTLVGIPRFPRTSAGPLNEMEQQLYLEILPGLAALFGHFHSQPCSFGPYSKFMTIGENRNVDRSVNRGLCSFVTVAHQYSDHITREGKPPFYSSIQKKPVFQLKLKQIHDEAVGRYIFRTLNYYSSWNIEHSTMWTKDKMSLS